MDVEKKRKRNGIPKKLNTSIVKKRDDKQSNAIDEISKPISTVTKGTSSLVTEEISNLYQKSFLKKLNDEDSTDIDELSEKSEDTEVNSIQSKKQNIIESDMDSSRKLVTVEITTPSSNRYLARKRLVSEKNENKVEATIDSSRKLVTYEVTTPRGERLLARKRLVSEKNEDKVQVNREKDVDLQNKGKKDDINWDTESDEHEWKWEIERLWSNKYYRRSDKVLYPNLDNKIKDIVNHRKCYDYEGELLVLWMDGTRDWSYVSAVEEDNFYLVDDYLHYNKLERKQMDFGKSWKKKRGRKKMRKRKNRQKNKRT